ncbi:MAG: phosphotransferase [Alphaproteobacteria bacterium]|nr:phosphotransferase [Alphaproteobacteria bacterium]
MTKTLKEKQFATRAEAMRQFVDDAGWQGATLKPLAGDASFRRYERVFHNGKQAVLMDAPPEKEDIAPFILVDKYLQSIGLTVPQIIAEDKQNGFLLLEDLGDDSYTRLLANCNDATLADQEKQLYLSAIEALAHLHNDNIQRPISLNVPEYNSAALMRELALFTDWFMPAVINDAAECETLNAEFLALWSQLLAKYPLQNNVVVLRDYHADNLLWLPQRERVNRVGLLDFQDALIGHCAYDMVSLLEDARRDVLPQTVEAAIEHYCTLTSCDYDSFMQTYAILGAQRQAKIIGIFVRLGIRDGKTHYTKFLPRVWGHFMHDLQHPVMADIRDWIEQHIQPQWRGAITLTPASAIS